MGQNLEPLKEPKSSGVTATFPQVAKRYGVSIPTVYRWLESVPEFPKPRKIGPNTVRFFVTELEAYENSAPVAAGHGEMA